jgi:hypothetical protein
MSWQLQATDLAGNPYGEIRDADALKIAFRLRQMPAVSFTIPVDHPRAIALRQLDLTLVKAYDLATGAKILRAIGPVVSAEKVRQQGGGTIAVTAGSPIWRLTHRLIGKSVTGASIGTPGAMVDRGEILGQIIDALNSGSVPLGTDAGDTGIRRGSIVASSKTYVGPWRFLGADEAFAQVLATLDAPDMEIAPVEPTADATGVQIGALNVAPAFGSINMNALWEFGAGRRNVETFREVGDASTLGNLLYHLPPGFPDNATQSVLSATDATSRTARGLHEAVVAGDIATDQLRQSLLDEALRMRKQPRLVVTFTPIAEDSAAPASERRVPRFGIDYVLGDVCPFRATERFNVTDSTGAVVAVRDVKTIDALFRVYGVDLDRDQNGVMKPTVILVQEDS